MLERVAGCLESGGRSLLRGRQALRTKRMLHSAFWHHGAGDLNLPPYMLPSMLVDTSQSKPAIADPTSLPDGFLLDFLYPPKTKAFLRDLASNNGDKLERHQGRQSHLNRYREYSSVASGELHLMGSQDEKFIGSVGQAQPPLDSAATSGFLQNHSQLDEDATIEQVNSGQRQKDALESLRALLATGKQDSYEEACRMMIAMDPTSHTYAEALADLLEFLSTSSKDVDAIRVLQFFTELKTDARRPSSYRAVVTANLRLQKLGRAVMVFDEAANSGFVEGVGVDFLLEQLIQRRLWYLGSYVYNTYRTGMKNRQDEDNLEPWQRLKDTSIPLNTVISLMDNVWQYSKCFNRESTPALMVFFRDLSMVTLKQQFGKLFLRPRQSHQRHVDHILRLVRYLSSLRFTNAEFYQKSIFKLNRREKVKSPEKANLVSSLYEMFRKESFFSPSQRILSVMMSELCHHEPRDEVLRHFTRIEDVAKDWSKFHGYLSNEIVRRILETFGQAGEVNLVHKYFGYLQNPSKEELQRSFYWLIYVHTRRADLNKAIWQFERMTQEFSVPPDCACYNALLQAYSRSDDIEGALRRFGEMEVNGVAPDAHSFGILMGLYADRGVPQCVSELFSIANSHGIIQTPHMWATLVRAHIENDDLITAEHIAEESSRTEAMRERATVVWNQVLTAYALRRDLESTLRIFERMRNDYGPLDSLTYAALMQCLVLIRQHDAARKILQKIIPKERVKRLALHYAIVMGGYVESKQWSRVLGLDAAMRQRGIKPSVSTRIRVLKAQVAVETRITRMRGGTHSTRLMTTEQALSDVLAASDRREATSAIKQPSYGLEGFSLNEAYPDAYYEVLISTYGRRKAFDIVDANFEEYLLAKDQPSPSSFIPPLQFLTALMQSHWKAREFDDIEKCWLLVYRKAMRYVKVPPIPKPDLSTIPSEVEPSQRLFSPARMAPSRRHIISRPLAFFIRSLAYRGEISRLISLIDELTHTGWILSNRVWNLYVQILVRNSQILLAFEICEKHLMPGWPGWCSGNALRRNPSKGHKKGQFGWIAIGTVLPSMLMPQYPTVVMLARAILDIQRASAYASDGKLKVSDVRDKAPKTVRAVETMPVLKRDPIQRKFLQT